MIRGIGPIYAKKMIKAFGEKVFDIIEAEPVVCANGLTDGSGPAHSAQGS